MATIVNRPNGHRWIQFKGLDGKRKTIRLGVATKQQATEFKTRVEFLLAARAMGEPPDMQTAQWVGRLAPAMHERLAASGLVGGRRVYSLADLLGEFFAALHVKASTRTHLEIIAANLRSFFGEARPIAEITAGDARQFRGWLADHGGKYGGELATATVSRRLRRAKQLFQFALDKRWLLESPFAKLAGWNEVNRSKDFFVDRELFEAVLDQAVGPEFRAVLALARYGGCRCPSEVLPIQWHQINWAVGTMVIISPKTAHHEGQAQRIVPIFPEVQDALDALWASADQGQPLLFPGLQISGTSLTDRLEAACRSAGVAMWPKPWQNMRASRETELFSEYEPHVVAAWMGHSASVALKHYAQITKEHQARAAGNLGKSVLRVSESESKAKQKAKHRTVSHSHAAGPCETENTKKQAKCSRTGSHSLGKAPRQGS